MSIFDRLYHLDADQHGRWLRQIVVVAQGLGLVVQEFGKDACVVRANALAYASLLAFVPLTAVVFSMFTVFSAFGDMKEKVQDFLFNNLIPAKSGEIMTYMNTFTANTKQLGAIGGVAMLVTSVMLFQNIEKNLNAVWKHVDRRKTVAKMMVFTAVLVWGTAFMGTGFYLTGKIQAMMIYREIMRIGFLSRVLLALLPFALSALAFGFILKVVPAARVRYRSAVVGGVTGAALFELGKKAFAHYASGAVSYSVIYGSLALIPLFLVWLYLTWLILMFATEVSFVHQNFRALMKSRLFGDLDSQKRMLLGLQIYLFIAERFREGLQPADADDVANRFGVPVELVEQILDAYVEHKLLVVTEEPTAGYVPGRSLGSVPARDLLYAVFRSLSESTEWPDQDGSDMLARRILEQFENGGYNAVGGDDLETLLKATGSLTG